MSYRSNEDDHRAGAHEGNAVAFCTLCHQPPTIEQERDAAIADAATAEANAKAALARAEKAEAQLKGMDAA